MNPGKGGHWLVTAEGDKLVFLEGEGSPTKDDKLAIAGPTT